MIDFLEVNKDGDIKYYTSKKEFEFFESIKETYVNYYNLYTFETWYNDENK